ncbi:hypothetical protein KUTeg_022791 [Tegillarca granosa]|uniref:F-box domain-containing protein n=1 Tax=Tegillarca granosa TaxID=220873 RepID=A0ABQ9DZT2_TEGGR|nr:hypothetical protein KUTeg_022791 [Tegillarca granosa]
MQQVGVVGLEMQQDGNVGFENNGDVGLERNSEVAFENDGDVGLERDGDVRLQKNGDLKLKGDGGVGSEIEDEVGFDADDSNNFPELLPPEIMRKIIRYTLDSNMTMLGTFNQVSHTFQELTKDYYPFVHIRDTIAGDLGLLNAKKLKINIRRLFNAAGKGSGLALRLKECLKDRKDWWNAWLVLSALSYSRYAISSIFWKSDGPMYRRNNEQSEQRCVTRSNMHDLTNGVHV